MNEKKYDYYYVTIDGRVGGLRTCYSANIVIKYNGHNYLIIDTAQYKYLYLF